MGDFMLFWNRPSWTIDQIPDMSGKVVLVTGGNSGTGYCTSSALYRAGAKVYLGCRNADKARTAIDRIERGLPGEGAYVAKGAEEWHRKDLLSGKSKGSLEFLKIDLEDLDSVNAAAEYILKNEQRLDVLYANAGIMMTPPGQYTKQGYSLQFGTNVLGHQRLIAHLLPLLQRTSRAYPDSPARIVVLSSAGHSMAAKGGVDYGVLYRPAQGDAQAPRNLDKMVDYGMSKWGNAALALYINDHYGPRSGNKDGEILTTSVHPGIVATNLSAHLTGVTAFFVAIISRLASVAPEIGTINQLWAGTMPVKQAREISGSYIIPHHRVGIARPDLRNREAVERMWNWCEQEGRKHT